MEKEMLKNDSMENQINSFRQSIKSINDSLSIPLESSTRSELEEIKLAMENKLKNTKQYFEFEIDKMKKEFKKEKEKYAINLKTKDETIQKLIINQDVIKEQEKNKFQVIIENYEKSLSVREREIEKLKAISKKWEMMYNYLKKKESQTGK